MKFTLRQLEVFAATARTENISKAAELLSMSQSAASTALKELESQFGISLFDRVGKRLRVNGLGMALRDKTASFLTEASEIENLLRQGQQRVAIQLGATMTIGQYLAIPLIQAFLLQHSAIKPRLAVANTETIVDKVLAFDLDCGLIEGEINHPELTILPWLEDHLCIFAASDHPLSQKTTITDQDLVDTPWILREHGSGTRQTFDRAMTGLLPKLNIFMELQQSEAIKQAVAAGMGISCLSTLALQSEQTNHAGQHFNNALVPLNIKKDFSRRFYLIVHKHKYQTSGMRQWLAFCQQWRNRLPP